MPQSLEGADYIESAQNNADVSDDRPPGMDTLLIEVDVAEGAVLYMFIDETQPTPFPWMNFADFGADWVDSGLDISWTRDDRIFNIWRTVGPLAAGTYNFRQLPVDSSFYGIAALLDTDGDGVVDNDDYCANTTIPEGVPWVQLRPDRWALIDDGSEFDTVIKGKGEGPKRSYTIEDTAGCSCEQIIEMQGLGNGHSYHGCSISAMDNWVDLVTP